MPATPAPPPWFLERGLRESTRPALLDARGSWTYRELSVAIDRVAANLGPIEGERVALLLGRTREAVAVFLGVLAAGGVAVPLSARSAPPEISYTLTDAAVTRLLADPPFKAAVEQADLPDATKLVDPASLLEGRATRRTRAVGADSPAVILYTSGTTGQPKGVVHTHASLAAQVDALHQAWEWTPGDRLLHVLPLHHVHGLVNGLLGGLRAGARVRLMEAFEPAAVWRAFAADDASAFYAVPTIYHRLLETWDGQDAVTQRRWAEGAGRLRLTVSGSAALPAVRWKRWRELTGQALLERYGMTEIGMALSNPYRGERRPGTVGQALPGMEARIVSESGKDVPAGTPGEIWVRGASLFKEYWNRPDATRDAFTSGWFRTGDVAEDQDGYVVIKGRSSVDIIKSGGYKLSALEIEEALREHPDVAEAAVIGLPDEEWGESVTACVIPRPGKPPTLDGLRDWCRARLAAYKAPRRLELCDDFPRNAMGKVTKPELIRRFG